MYRGLPGTWGRATSAIARLAAAKRRRRASGHERSRQARRAARPAEKSAAATPSQARAARRPLERRPVAGVVPHQHRPVVGHHQAELLAEAGGQGGEARLSRRVRPRLAGQQVVEREPLVRGVPEPARRIPHGPPEAEREEGAWSRRAAGQDESGRDREERDDREDVAPEAEAQEQPRGQGETRAVVTLARPARGEPERPGAEGQHLHVVAVVAEAVAGDEGRAEGGVEAGEQRRAGARHEEREAEEAGDVGEVEQHGDEGEGAGRVENGGERGGQVRLEAAAVGHVGHEDLPRAPVRDVQGHDARQGAVGRDRRSRTLHDHGETKEEGQQQHQDQQTGGRGGGRPGEDRPARPEPGGRGEERGGEEGQRRHGGQDAGAPGLRHVEPLDAEHDPEQGPRGAGQRRRIGAAARVSGWARRGCPSWRASRLARRRGRLTPGGRACHFPRP